MYLIYRKMQKPTSHKKKEVGFCIRTNQPSSGTL